LGVDDEFDFPIHLSCLNESITRKNIFDFIFMMKHFEALIR